MANYYELLSVYGNSDGAVEVKHSIRCDKQRQQDKDAGDGCDVQCRRRLSNTRKSSYFGDFSYNAHVASIAKVLTRLSCLASVRM